jgi:CheY-like chemotaxis protein
MMGRHAQCGGRLARSFVVFRPAAVRHYKSASSGSDGCSGFSVAQKRWCMMKPEVFVVEDNSVLVRIYEALLLSLGCSCSWASTVSEAMGMLDGISPDLAVVDLRLPDGSGTEVIRAIRDCARLRNIPVLTVTTSCLEDDKQASIELGATAFLTKPIVVDDFVKLVRHHLPSF